MISVEEAFERIIGSAKPLRTERLALVDSVSRVLAAPLTARKSQPGTALSAMDGYAVKSSDLSEGVTKFKIVGEIPAGTRSIPTLTSGQAYRIFTGAPVPEGADQVIIQENVRSIAEHTIETETAPEPMANIRALGTDFMERQVVRESGAFITPKSIGLIAAAGYDHVMVHRAPRVVLLSTGDELTPADKAKFEPGDTVESNTPMLASFLRDAGAIIEKTYRLRDDQTAIQSAIRECTDADIIITIGGASVGDHDYVKDALNQEGMELDFWKIAMRPGKPLIYGTLNERHVIGLPGNPVSAFVCALIFVRPLIDRLMGRPAPLPSGVMLPVAVDLPENGPRQHYMRARLVGNPGSRHIDPAASQDSSLLSVLSESDGLLVRQPNAPALKAGDPVPFLPF